MSTKFYKYMTGENFNPMPDKEFFEMIDENNDTLNKCSNHSFNVQIGPKCWTCENCGGVVDTRDKRFYELGKLHANNK